MKYSIKRIRKPVCQRFADLEETSKSILPILASDVLVFCARIDKDQYDSISARAAVRCYFSEVEVIIYFMKELTNILCETKKFGGILSEDEKEKLAGKRHEIKRGKLREIILPRQGFLDKVKFVLKIYSKIHNIDYRIDHESKGWQKFVVASKIRHRFTHPSKIGDVDVSREDYDTVAFASKWFIDQQKEIDRLKHNKHFDY